jgi:hypothetical protein
VCETGVKTQTEDGGLQISLKLVMQGIGLIHHCMYQYGSIMKCVMQRPSDGSEGGPGGLPCYTTLKGHLAALTGALFPVVLVCRYPCYAVAPLTGAFFLCSVSGPLQRF